MSKGLILVFCQFFLIALILMNCEFIAKQFWGISIQVSGIIIGLVSIFQMKIKNLAIKPEPKENAELIQTGLYKYIRHPMYLSILVFLFPLIQFELNSNSLVIYLLLYLVLGYKIKFEESLLKSKFPEYENYMSISKRLIPFIY